MKKLVLFLIAILFSMWGYGQATPFNGVRVANATTVLNVNISIGTQVWDIGASKLWQCTAATASTLTLTTGSANFIQIGGTGMGGSVTNVTGSMYLNITNGTTTPRIMPAVGIAKDSLAKMDSLATAGQYAKFGTKGLVGRSAASMYSELGVKTAVVTQFEAAVDSISGHCYFDITNAPVSTTVSVELNGVPLKATTQYTVVTHYVRVSVPVYMYDRLEVRRSY